MTAPRWSIWIDIEGFGKLWETGPLALQGLRALTSGIYAIGSRVYAGDGERIFAHQFGDGFVIVSDFHETALDRCVAIAVVLMRHVARSGCLAAQRLLKGTSLISLAVGRRTSGTKWRAWGRTMPFGLVAVS